MWTEFSCLKWQNAIFTFFLMITLLVIQGSTFEHENIVHCGVKWCRIMPKCLSGRSVSKQNAEKSMKFKFTVKHEQLPPHSCYTFSTTCQAHEVIRLTSLFDWSPEFSLSFILWLYVSSVCNVDQLSFYLSIQYVLLLQYLNRTGVKCITQLELL